MLKKFYPWKEPFLAGSHFFGAILGVLGTIALLYQCSNEVQKVTVALVYGISLSSLFLISGLLHAIHCSKEEEHLLERLDYIAIYIFIAATYTPFCVFLVGGSLGTMMLCVQWLMAIIGVFCTVRWGFACKGIQISIFLLMGWAFLFVAKTVATMMAPTGLILLISGAAFYSVGAVIFAFAPVYLYREKISSHAIWHVFVLFGALAHYLMISGVLIS